MARSHAPDCVASCTARSNATIPREFSEAAAKPRLCDPFRGFAALVSQCHARAKAIEWFSLKGSDGVLYKRRPDRYLGGVRLSK